MDSQYLYNNQSTMQKEINAKYQIASKELQNLYKRSTMIEPLLQILEDIYSKVDEGAAIAPLSLSINQIKSLNADIKTCLLNVKEKKSGPFQRIIKNKGENIEALESKMDKLIKDLEVALNNAEEAAKKSSEKKRQQKASSNNNNKYNEQAQPTKYSLTDNYPQDYYNTTENYSNNYSYNNNAANDYSYQETNNYNNNNNNNNNTGLDASLANQFSYLNVNDGNNAGNNNNAQVNDNAKYNYDNNTNTNQQAQPQISVQPPDYQESQETYNSYPQDTSGQFYNTYSNPSQQYYYGTLTKPDQQQQQQQQQMNNYNQYQQQNPQMMYNDPNQLQMQQMQMQQMQMQQMQMQQQMQQQQMQQQQMQQQQMQQQQMQQQQMQQQQMQQQQMQQQQMQQQQMQQMQQISPSQISSSEATTMDGDSSINQKGLIPPTQYFAISSFTPRQPDELAIEQGDEVIIVQTFDDGWAFGRNSRTRMVGVLPMTFLSINNQFNNYQYSNELPDRQSSRRL